MKRSVINLIFFLISTTLYSQVEFKEKIDSLAEQIKSPRGASALPVAILSPFLIKEREVIDSGVCNPFDLTKATKDEFHHIDGIDRFLAKNIVSFREKNGLNSIEDLHKIRGVGEIEFKQIKNYILKSRECLKPKVEKRVEKKIAKKVVRRAKLKVQMIFNNRAKISNRWYKKGDLLRGYKIEEIGFDFVKIQNKYSEKILRLENAPEKRGIVMEVR